MVVPPVEGSLDRSMKWLEIPIQRHDEAPPDLRLDLA
jgi:hypothetical protein